MPTITFLEPDGKAHVVEAQTGLSVMEAATRNMVPGIIGECGGCCTCATCHGYVDGAWVGRLKPRSEDETMMLDGALAVASNSRLTCQITVQPELDGLVVRLPESQF